MEGRDSNRVPTHPSALVTNVNQSRIFPSSSGVLLVQYRGGSEGWGLDSFGQTDLTTTSPSVTGLVLCGTYHLLSTGRQPIFS